MECNLGWNNTRDFKINRACSASLIWNHKYDFRPKLHDTRFNYHFIMSILKLPKCRTWSLQMFYWCSTEIKFINFWGGGGDKSLGNKSSKICHTILFVYHFLAILLVTLNKPWNLIGCFVFSVACSLAGKKIWFKAINGVIHE